MQRARISRLISRILNLVDLIQPNICRRNCKKKFDLVYLNLSNFFRYKHLNHGTNITRTFDHVIKRETLIYRSSTKLFLSNLSKLSLQINMLE